jgi:hypothetical protein
MTRFVKLVLALAALGAIVLAGRAAAPAISHATAADAAPAAEGTLPAMTGPALTPAQYNPEYSATPPTISAALIDRAQNEVDRIGRAERSMRSMIETVAPAVSPAPVETAPGAGPAADPPQAAGTLQTFRSSVLAPPAGYSSSVNEPSQGVGGKNVFYSHNWYAARSTTGGASWVYTNPFADMADFCCDQDVVYDRGRNLMVWYRQGIYNVAPAPAGQNRIKIGVSTNGGSSFCTYTLTPTNINAAYTNQWFDYPQLALSNDYLYLTSNMFNAADVYQRTILMRFSLDTMAACASTPFNYWTTTTGTMGTVQGATETMYLGTNINNTTFRVYTQPEATTALSFVDKTVPAWDAITNGNPAVCTLTTPVVNPCARSDSRVSGGWVAKGTIGFFWNARQGVLAKPYANAVAMTEAGKSILGGAAGRPYIYNSSYAFQYASAAPNARGDLGVVVGQAGGSIYPRPVIGIEDDFTAAPPPWSLVIAASGTTWNQPKWGDYFRARSAGPSQTYWSASGVTATTISGVVTYQPRFFEFGRGRDIGSFNRFGTS